MFDTAVADPVDAAPAAAAAPRPAVRRPEGAGAPGETSLNVTGRAGVVTPEGAGRGSILGAVAEEDDRRFPKFPDSLKKDLVRVFKLLSDETRLRILLYLAREGELHVTALCKRLEQSQPAVSHHLALLRNAEIIEPRRDGKHNFYSIRQQRFVGLLEEFFATVRDPETDAVEFDDFVLSKGN